jgi:hypothetical protein
LAAIAPLSPRATLWLPLLRQLTDEVPDWLVIKNAAAALDGVGDIDSMACPEDWPAIERIFRMWASEHGLTMVGVCRHIWRGPNLVAWAPSDPYLMVLDVKAVRTFRGAPLITVTNALPLAESDAAGFRRMRAGGEGVIKLLHNGTARGARRNAAGLDAKGVVSLLAADPDGADLAAAWTGRSAPPLRRAIRAVVRGRWPRRDLLLVEAGAMARAVGHPGPLIRQLGLRATGERCPFIHLTRHDHRRLPEDGKAWITLMRRTHPGSTFSTMPEGAMG